MKAIHFLLLLSCMTFASSCASSYRPINPKQLKYTSNVEKDSVLMEYKYDVLRRQNSKKERKSGVSLIAVKVTNYSQRDLMFGQDIRISNKEGHEMYLLDTEQIHRKLKQQPAGYLAYLLFSFGRVYVENSNGERTYYKYGGLVLGASLAVGNMAMAASSNNSFKTELLTYNLNGATIKKGETAYGLIGIGNINFSPLTLVVKPIEVLGGD